MGLREFCNSGLVSDCVCVYICIFKFIISLLSQGRKKPSIKLSPVQSREATGFDLIPERIHKRIQRESIRENQPCREDKMVCARYERDKFRERRDAKLFAHKII